MNRPIRTLLFSSLYPSQVRPVHGIFVETRLRELLKTGQVETKVVAPVPWFPFKAKRFGEYAQFAATLGASVPTGSTAVSGTANFVVPTSASAALAMADEGGSGNGSGNGVGVDPGVDVALIGVGATWESVLSAL